MKNKQYSFLAAALLAIPSLVCAQLGANPDEFFKPGPLPSDSLSEELPYPLGKMFPFSFFSLGGGSSGSDHVSLSEEEVKVQFARYKAAGFQIFGPQYEMSSRALKDAETHGLKVVYTIKYKDDRLFHAKEPAVIDPVEVYADIRRQVEAVMDNSAIVIWYLQPEEIRPWRKNEMAFLEAASKAIRETDPKKRPLWVYDPAHASANRLASIAPWVDYLGKGMYANYASMQENRIWCRWSIEQQVQAIEESGAKSIPLAVPEMYHDSRRPPLTQEDIARIPQWVPHDSWLALISGAKGIFVFSLRQRPSLPPEAWEAYYQAYEKLGRDLLGEKQLGQVILFGESRDDIAVDITEGPAEVELLYPSGGVKEPITYPSVSHRAIAYGKDRYLFLANSANEPVEIAIGGLPYASVLAQSLLDDSAPFDIGEGEFTATLAPLEVRAYRLSRR